MSKNAKELKRKCDSSFNMKLIPPKICENVAMETGNTRPKFQTNT